MTCGRDMTGRCDAGCQMGTRLWGEDHESLGANLKINFSLDPVARLHGSSLLVIVQHITKFWWSIKTLHLITISDDH